MATHERVDPRGCAARVLLPIAEVADPIPILVFAPRRWRSIPEPSRRVLARLALCRPVFVLEDDAPADPASGREFWELERVESDVVVCRPRAIRSLGPMRIAARLRRTRALMHWLDVGEFVAWLYEPSALGWVRVLAPSLVIRDRSLEAWRPATKRAWAARAAAAFAAAEEAGAI